jgi:hypothetical protein
MKIGRVYKIKCNDTHKIYIGSTKKQLHKRLSEHLSCYRNYIKKINTKSNYHNPYYSSFKILKYNNVTIELLEQIPYNKIELLKLESKYIKDNNDISVNACYPVLLSSTKLTNYYKKNKKYINRKVKCECGSNILKRNLSVHYKSSKHINYSDKPKIISS